MHVTTTNAEYVNVDLGAPYTIVDPPCGDNEEIAAKGKRVLIRHLPRSGQVHIVIAPKNLITSGWVIGIISE